MYPAGTQNTDLVHYSIRCVAFHLQPPHSRGWVSLPWMGDFPTVRLQKGNSRSDTTNKPALLLPVIQSLQRHNVAFAVGKIFVEATNICKDFD